jgi:hypothetical protein
MRRRAGGRFMVVGVARPETVEVELHGYAPGPPRRGTRTS